MALSLRENVFRARRLPRNEQILMGRAELLAREDRDLIEAVLVRGQTAESLARLAGRSGTAKRERVGRLTRRLSSRRFLDAARALAYLSDEDAMLARLAFCQRKPQRDLCERTGLTRHLLRRRLDRIAAQIQTIRRMSHNPHAPGRLPRG